MSSASLEDLLARAAAAVRRAAAFALNPGEELRIEAKAHRNDLVTQVDRGVEERIARQLEDTGIPLHGEEKHRIEDFEAYRGRAWVLDPIDGTLNYVSTHRDWAISLALVDDGVPVLAILADPVADRLYTAIRGRGAPVHRDRPCPHPDGRGALRRAPRRVAARSHPRGPRRGARASVRRRRLRFAGPGWSARSYLRVRVRGVKGANATPTLRTRERSAVRYVQRRRPCRC